MAPWGRLSGVIFSSLQNIKLSVYRALLGGEHLRPLREKGGTTVGFPPQPCQPQKKHPITFGLQLNLEKNNFFMTCGLHCGTFFSQIRPQEVPGGALGSTLGAPLPPDLKIHASDHFFRSHFGRCFGHIFHVFLMCFSSEFFKGLWTMFS